MPSGTHGYDDLRRDATELEILGVHVPLASLADIIRSKEAADRPKDRLTLPMLRRILDEGPRARIELGWGRMSRLFRTMRPGAMRTGLPRLSARGCGRRTSDTADTENGHGGPGTPLTRGSARKTTYRHSPVGPVEDCRWLMRIRTEGVAEGNGRPGVEACFRPRTSSRFPSNETRTVHLLVLDRRLGGHMPMRRLNDRLPQCHSFSCRSVSSRCGAKVSRAPTRVWKNPWPRGSELVPNIVEVRRWSPA